MKTFKKTFCGIMAAACLAACNTQKTELYHKELKTEHKYISHNGENIIGLPINLDNAIKDLCIITTVEYNRKYDYFTIYAYSTMLESEFCIADDIKKETMLYMYQPGARVIRYLMPGVYDYTGEILISKIRE